MQREQAASVSLTCTCHTLAGVELRYVNSVSQLPTTSDNQCCIASIQSEYKVGRVYDSLHVTIAEQS